MSNDFSGIPSVVALYNFESGALGTDSIDANTLTLVNTPTADTGKYKQGAASVALVNASSQYLYAADASLSSNFPFKSGTSNLVISVCCWIYANTTGTSRRIWSKFDFYGSKRSIDLEVNGTTIVVNIGDGAGSFNIYSTSLTIATGIWYHVSVIFDGNKRILFVSLYNSNTTTTTTYSNTNTRVPGVGSSDFMVGTSGTYGSNIDANYWDGNVDELVVFNNTISASDISNIIAGTFSSAVVGSDRAIASGLAAAYDPYPKELIKFTGIITPYLAKPVITNEFAGLLVLYDENFAFRGNLKARTKIQSQTSLGVAGWTYTGYNKVIARPISGYERGAWEGELFLKTKPQSLYYFFEYTGNLPAFLTPESLYEFLVSEGHLFVKATPQAWTIGPPKEYNGNLRALAKCQAIYYDVDFFYIGLTPVIAKPESSTEGPGTWNMLRLMRHGDWFGANERHRFLFGGRRNKTDP